MTINILTVLVAVVPEQRATHKDGLLLYGGCNTISVNVNFTSQFHQIWAVLCVCVCVFYLVSYTSSLIRLAVVVTQKGNVRLCMLVTKYMLLSALGDMDRPLTS